MVEAIQEISNNGKLHTLRDLETIRINNGIYILFEEGENSVNGKLRIVMIGINGTNGRFKLRLVDHFMGEHRGSVFRKHVGRALLMKLGKQAYLPIWGLSNKVPLHHNKIDWEFEYEIENLISEYIRGKFAFSVIEVNEDRLRKGLEAKLISSLAFDRLNRPSKSWLGHFHPNKKIPTSGLWNVHHLQGTNKLAKNDLAILNSNLIR